MVELNKAEFESFIEKTDTCWLWRGYVSTHHGYGFFHGKRAHRLAYEFYVGPIPEGLVIDHICRNLPCVNPDHLEAVTQGENARRGYGAPALNSRKARCPRGHPLKGENLKIDWEGTRRCRICWLATQRKANAKQRAKKRAARLAAQA